MITIDATNRTLGRVASEAAAILMGKNTPAFQKNLTPKTEVTITNASKTRISRDKLKTKEYKRFSGYPGGLKSLSMEKVIDKKGYEEIYRHAIRGMLPVNKLRSDMLKNLTITD